MVDIARALAVERGDGTSADMVLWARAVLSSIEAHRDDIAQIAAEILHKRPFFIIARRTVVDFVGDLGVVAGVGLVVLVLVGVGLEVGRRRRRRAAGN